MRAKIWNSLATTLALSTRFIRDIYLRIIGVFTWAFSIYPRAGAEGLVLYRVIIHVLVVHILSA